MRLELHCGKYEGPPGISSILGCVRNHIRDRVNSDTGAMHPYIEKGYDPKTTRFLQL